MGLWPMRESQARSRGPCHGKRFMQLNPQQEQVASHKLGRILTLAGPGSGKTRTLTERTGRLIKARVKPENTLCLTFPNKARDERRERLQAGVRGGGRKGGR